MGAQWQGFMLLQGDFSSLSLDSRDINERIYIIFLAQCSRNLILFTLVVMKINVYKKDK